MLFKQVLFYLYIKKNEYKNLLNSSYSGKTRSFYFRPSEKIEELKYQLDIEENIDYNDQRLTFNNQILDDSRTFDDYGIQDGSYINLSNKARFNAAGLD